MCIAQSNFNWIRVILLTYHFEWFIVLCVLLFWTAVESHQQIYDHLGWSVMIKVNAGR